MKLNSKNYYSLKANKEYMSVSQLKKFIGTPFLQACEARAMAEIKGKWTEEKTDALVIGSYVDAALLGSEKDLKVFKTSNPELFSARGATKGQMKAKYAIADVMVDRAKRDTFFMSTLDGNHQEIVTGTIFGVPFKGRLDVLNLKKGFITDLKTCQSITKEYYDSQEGKKVSFVKYHDYILQGAIYQELARQKYDRILPFFLACISKEPEPDIAVIQIDTDTMRDYLFGNDDAGENGLEDVIKAAYQVKCGEVAPTRCENCDYCKHTKVLQSPINWLDIGG